MICTLVTLLSPSSCGKIRTVGSAGVPWRIPCWGSSSISLARWSRSSSCCRPASYPPPKGGCASSCSPTPLRLRTLPHACKYRRPLLSAGVRLFGMKREGDAPTARDVGLTGSSASSLHAKTFSVDGRRIFAGSFNMDPRSVNLNTETGLMIESPALAGELQRALEEKGLAHAYAVSLEDGELRLDHPGGGARGRLRRGAGERLAATSCDPGSVAAADRGAAVAATYGRWCRFRRGARWSVRPPGPLDPILSLYGPVTFPRGGRSARRAR